MLDRDNNVLVRIGLGTAQFGQDYGVTNRTGRIPEAAARTILKTAAVSGVSLLDTAAAYGDSEAVLGRTMPGDASFRIVTKTPSVAEAIVTADHVESITEAFRRSLDLVGRDAIYGLLVHHGRDLLKPGGDRLAEFLLGQKFEGRAARIGVSVYSADEIDRILEHFTPDIVQLPVSVADQRLIRSGHLRILKDLDIEVHARSIFLQGALLELPDRLPDFFAPVRAGLEVIGRDAAEQGLGRLDACLAFALGRPELDVVIIGVSALHELNAIIESARRVAGRTFDADALAIADERYLDPSRWRL